ncbi:MAG TPA: hypothetical protein VGI81_03065 [Tepidisphaeraceae bacterium]
MAELALAEQAILRLLWKDASGCRKICHFDPGWVARKLRLDERAFQAADQNLASMGLVSIHEFEWKQVRHLTDIALIDDSIPPA